MRGEGGGDVGAQHGQLDKASTMQANSERDADRAPKEAYLVQTKLKSSKRGDQIGQRAHLVLTLLELWVELVLSFRECAILMSKWTRYRMESE